MPNREGVNQMRNVDSRVKRGRSVFCGGGCKVAEAALHRTTAGAGSAGEPKAGASCVPVRSTAEWIASAQEKFAAIMLWGEGGPCREGAPIAVDGTIRQKAPTTWHNTSAPTMKGASTLNAVARVVVMRGLILYGTVTIFTNDVLPATGY